MIDIVQSRLTCLLFCVLKPTACVAHLHSLSVSFFQSAGNRKMVPLRKTRRKRQLTFSHPS
ncbi:hypothetical protein GMO_15240 [Gluconobacter morbifer G707]|uniref:Uncharacterized protein n=1 Tax=Gluconobacter morbifer G707 TaxID=1088869 RepID=G6XJ58_9PROT|nr:hypothetical protein GMO_15240 [Gluconobacter morbifer G707]